MGWPRFLSFGRRQGKGAGANPPPEKPPCDDWHPGDQAVCVTDGTWQHEVHRYFTPGPQLHEVNRVTDVKVGSGRASARYYLQFARWPGSWFAAHDFRKVTPRADSAIAADAAFVSDFRQRLTPAPQHQLVSDRSTIPSRWVFVSRSGNGAPPCRVSLARRGGVAAFLHTLSADDWREMAALCVVVPALTATVAIAALMLAPILSGVPA